MQKLRVGITTMASEPPDRFRALAGLVEDSGFDELAIGAGDRPVTELGHRMALVADDVRDGLVSIDAARREYGVVIDPTNLRVDETRTTALRASRGSA